MRAEINKVSNQGGLYDLQGSRDGEKIKKIVADGGIVPYELTVQLLINALIAHPAKVGILNLIAIELFD
jgi:hypothetical protein